MAGTNDDARSLPRAATARTASRGEASGGTVRTTHATAAETSSTVSGQNAAATAVARSNRLPDPPSSATVLASPTPGRWSRTAVTRAASSATGTAISPTAAKVTGRSPYKVRDARAISPDRRRATTGSGGTRRHEVRRNRN